MVRISLGIVFLVLLAAPASAWGDRGWIPPCDYTEVIARVKDKFAYADRKTFHWGVAIEDVTGIYEQHERYDYRGLIQRRYCQGTAWLSDGSRSDVVYLIEGKQGFASTTYNVQSCLPAYDPWRVYDGWCRSIEP